MVAGEYCILELGGHNNVPIVIVVAAYLWLLLILISGVLLLMGF